jgi:hypothetical protein
MILDVTNSEKRPYRVLFDFDIEGRLASIKYVSLIPERNIAGASNKIDFNFSPTIEQYSFFQIIFHIKNQKIADRESVECQENFN